MNIKFVSVLNPEFCFPFQLAVFAKRPTTIVELIVVFEKRVIVGQPNTDSSLRVSNVRHYSLRRKIVAYVRRVSLY